MSVKGRPCRVSPKSLANLTPRKKGQPSLNPLGPNVNGGSELQKIRRLSGGEIAAVGALILDKNVLKLKEIVDDAKSNPESKHSVLKVWMATTALRGINKGDPHALDALLNRIVGRVRHEVELLPPPPPEPPKPETNKLAEDERDARIAELKAMLEETTEIRVLTPEVLPPDGESNTS